jgi:hypothetical protein
MVDLPLCAAAIPLGITGRVKFEGILVAAAQYMIE